MKQIITKMYTTDIIVGNRNLNKMITFSVRKVFARPKFWKLWSRSTPRGGPPQSGQVTILKASSIASFSHLIFLFSSRSKMLAFLSIWVYIIWKVINNNWNINLLKQLIQLHIKIFVEMNTLFWVLLFWNQNLIWSGSRFSSSPKLSRCDSSGLGHSLK